MNQKPVTGFKLVYGTLGEFLLLIGVIMLVPIILIAFYPEEYPALFPFLFTAGIDFLLGIFLFFFFLSGKERQPFKRYQDSHLLVLIWVSAILSGAMPFFIANLMGSMNMSFSESFFEAASAYTTTGLTAHKDFVDGLVTIDATTGASYVLDGQSFCPHVFTFHRAFMQFIGGMGLVLLVASILGGGNGVSLYTAEGHSDKLLPNIAKSAKLIFGIYSLYTIVGSILLWVSGLPWFDAITTAMSALSGGGFNCRSTNIAYYRGFDGSNILNGVTTMNSLAVEIIMIILVCLSAISFVLHTFLLRGKFRLFFRDDENKMFFVWIFFMTLFGFLGVCGTFNKGAYFFENSGEYLRDSAFYVIGSITTSGFLNTAADSMYALGKLGRPLLMICTLCMLIGGGMGSTAGGIKMYRIVLCAKEFGYYIRTKFASTHQMFPKTTFRHGAVRDVDDGAAKEAHMYLVLFLGVFVVLVAIITYLPGYGPTEYGVESAAFDVASAISNTGIALNDFVTYGAAHPIAGKIALWTLSLGMILGRLEILPLGYWIENIRLEVKLNHDNKRAARMATDAIE